MGWLSAGLAIAGGIMGARAQSQAADAAREAAKAQAGFTYETRMEEIRRERINMRYIESLARARAAGSGVEMGGTPMLYEQYLKAENLRQENWAISSAAQERRAIRQGAPGSGAAKLASASEMLSGITSAIGLYNREGL